MYNTNYKGNKLDINLTLDIKSLSTNSNSRIPICLVLDTSASMLGEPMKELNEGVNFFFDTIKKDEIACYSAEIAIITFGGIVSKALDFRLVNEQDIPVLQGNGNTPMGEAMNTAISLLELRKQQYSLAGVDYYQPWIVLMTDGAPTDNIREAAEKTTAMVLNRKLTLFPIGIGSQADLNTLADFSPNNAPVRLNSLDFTEFFEWLSKSVSILSESTPGDHINLPSVNWTA